MEVSYLITFRNMVEILTHQSFICKREKKYLLQFNQPHYTEGTTNNKQKENGRRVIIISDRTFCFSCNLSPFLVMLFEIFYNLSIIFHKKLHLIFRMLFYKECFDKLNTRLMTKILGNIYWILSKCQSLCQVLYTVHFTTPESRFYCPVFTNESGTGETLCSRH